MKSEVRLKRNVYIIVIGILVLAIMVQVAHSQFVMQSSRNHNFIHDRQSLEALSKQVLPVQSTEPLYCVVYDSRDEYSVKVKNNTEKVLRYMKKNTAIINSVEAPLQAEKCRAVIVTNQQLDLIPNSSSLVGYVENGGFVMFASSLEQDRTFYEIYRKLGFIGTGEPYQAIGIELKSNVLVGVNGLKIDQPFIVNTANSAEIDGEAQLLAISTKGTPLMWKRDYGKGSFVVFNGTMLQEKYNRGLLAGGLSLLEPEFMYPIFNTKQMFIDDFPAPFPKGTKPVLYDAYHKDIPKFYHDIWWPDMLRLAKQTDIKYTAVLIQSYLDRVTPPFRYPIDEERYNLISYGREIIKSGGEIGIHGYNHQPLQLNQEAADHFGYKAWPNIENMVESVQEVVRFFRGSYPSYNVTTYVPPSNVLSNEGRKALLEAWPELIAICSLYQEDASNLSFVQEFEIAEDGVVEMPRVTSGFLDEPFERWEEANTITTLGVFSHFVHPDDVIDDARGKNLSWEKLYDGLTEKLKRVKATYPWLRAMTATEGANSLVNSLTSQVSLKFTTEGIQGQIINFKEDSFFILRTERNMRQLKNCDVKKIDEHTYLVTAKKEKFEIGLGG